MEVEGRLIVPQLTTAPSAPVEGEIYWDTDDDKFYVWNGSTWIDLGSTSAQTFPSARVYRTTNLSLTHDTQTVITFDAERWDNDSMHSTGSNTERLVATTSGVYNIYANVRFAANSTGIRQIALVESGSTLTIARESILNAGSSVIDLTIQTEWKFTAGQYVRLFGYQNSGGALNLEALATSSLEFGMTWQSAG
jgi:hypothetical protein